MPFISLREFVMKTLFYSGNRSDKIQNTMLYIIFFWIQSLSILSPQVHNIKDYIFSKLFSANVSKIINDSRYFPLFLELTRNTFCIKIYRLHVKTKLHKSHGLLAINLKSVHHELSTMIHWFILIKSLYLISLILFNFNVFS